MEGVYGFVGHSPRKRSLRNDEAEKFVSNILLKNENGFVLSEGGIE